MSVTTTLEREIFPRGGEDTAFGQYFVGQELPAHALHRAGGHRQRHVRAGLPEQLARPPVPPRAGGPQIRAGHGRAVAGTRSGASPPGPSTPATW